MLTPAFYRMVTWSSKLIDYCSKYPTVLLLESQGDTTLQTEETCDLFRFCIFNVVSERVNHMAIIAVDKLFVLIKEFWDALKGDDE